MEQLASNFDKAYPTFATSKFETCCKVEEPGNNIKGFQRIELTGIDGITFPHELANKTSSFANISGHTSILKKDCDGIILFEKNGQKYILFCELKSTFSTEEIAKATNQLIGSYVKMKGLLSTLQGYDVNVYKPLGLIVSFEPTQEQLTAISKLDNSISFFAITLKHQRVYHMPEEKCKKFFHPLSIGDFDIYYVGVPDRQKTYCVDVNDIFLI